MSAQGIITHENPNFEPRPWHFAVAPGSGRASRSATVQRTGFPKPRREAVMRTNKIFIATIVVSACVYSSPGDVVELKNGNIINGKYNGGTGSTLRIKNDAGEQVIDTSQVVAITFTAGKQAPAAPTPAAPGGTAPSATTPELPSPTGRPPQS